MDFEDLDYEKITELLNKRDEEEKRALKKKKNLKGKLATTFTLIPWGLMLAVWILIESASPGREMRFITTFFNVHFGAEPMARPSWNYNLIYTAYVLMLVSLGLCLIAFTINVLGRRREGEKIRISVFIIGSITIIAFIFFMINFWSVIF